MVLAFFFLGLFGVCLSETLIFFQKEKWGQRGSFKKFLGEWYAKDKKGEMTIGKRKLCQMLEHVDETEKN